MDAPLIQYVRTEDDVNIAYAVAGDGPPVLVCLLPFSHVQLGPELGLASPIPHLVQEFQTAWLDTRGTGLSDRDVADGSFDARLTDIHAVVDKLHWDRFAIYASGIACFPVVRFAARHPQRVSKLVLSIPFARGADFIGRSSGPAASPLADVDRHLWAETIARGSGLTDPTLLERAADMFVRSISEEQYHAILEEVGRTDMSDDLARLHCPAIIIAVEQMRAVPADLSRGVAARIPDSRLVLVNNLFQDVDQYNRVTRNFLREDAADDGGDTPTADTAPSPFRTILFTDVVASTPLLTQLKDAKMRDVMRDHDAVLTAAIEQHGGRVIKEIGDAFMAEFAVPSAAVEAAIAMQRGIQAKFADSDVPIRLRIGINAGEPVVEDDDLHGLSVVIAKRLESAAPVNGILVADALKQLLAGKDFAFTDQGDVLLKGLDDPLRAWSVEWTE